MLKRVFGTFGVLPDCLLTSKSQREDGESTAPGARQALIPASVEHPVAKEDNEVAKTYPCHISLWVLARGSLLSAEFLCKASWSLVVTVKDRVSDGSNRKPWL